MKEIKVSGKDYKVVASPVTLYFYKKEFKRDLIGDMMRFEGLNESAEVFDSMIVLQMTWAMIKTAKGGQFVDFKQWLESLEHINFEDTVWFNNVIDEAATGFFRGREQTQGQSERESNR